MDMGRYSEVQHSQVLLYFLAIPHNCFHLELSQEHKPILLPNRLLCSSTLVWVLSAAAPVICNTGIFHQS